MHFKFSKFNTYTVDTFLQTHFVALHTYMWLKKRYPLARVANQEHFRAQYLRHVLIYINIVFEVEVQLIYII